MRWIRWGLAGLAALVLAAGLAGWFLLDRVELGPLAARRASARLGRTVSFGSLHVVPGRWLRVTVEDARLANLPGGTRDTMAVLAHGTAEVELWPLLGGTVNTRSAVVDGLDVLLEHVPGGDANWRFTPGAPPKREGGAARTGRFPTLLNLVVTGKIAIRTLRGNELRVGLDRMTFSAPDLEQPSHLAGGGSYKDVPIQLDAALGSIALYRDAATPFPVDLQMASGGTQLHFVGTMTDPLDVDGAEGALAVEAPGLDVLGRLFGLGAGFDQALALHGRLERADPVWQLSQAQGTLGPAPIADATIRLEEGRPGADPTQRTPDRVGLAVRFGTLDLDALLGHGGDTGGPLSLAVDRAPPTLLAAKLTAPSVRLGGIRVTDAALEASQTQGQVAVSALSFGYGGGKVSAKGTLDAAGEGGRLSAELQAAGLDVQALRSLFDGTRIPLTGRLDVHAAVSATGATLAAAEQDAHASLVLTMAGGSVSRQLVRLGSTDLRALGGESTGTVPLSCGLGVMDVRNGIGTVAPLRLRTAEGTLAAHGTVDLRRRSLDMTVASEARTTGPLALDVPMRVHGPLADVSVVPAELSGGGRAQAEAGDQTGRLLGSVQAASRASPCSER